MTRLTNECGRGNSVGYGGIHNRGKCGGMNYYGEGTELPIEDVICSAHTKCKKPCHHAKPHAPSLVTNQGFRGKDTDAHVDHPDGIICTTKGRCDMGLFVKCEKEVNHDQRPDQQADSFVCGAGKVLAQTRP